LINHLQSSPSYQRLKQALDARKRGLADLQIQHQRGESFTVVKILNRTMPIKVMNLLNMLIKHHESNTSGKK
jgi:hypothetical protein